VNSFSDDFVRLYHSLDSFMPWYFQILNPILHRLEKDGMVLGENQVKVLMALSYQTNLSPVDISQIFLIPKTSLTTIIRSLEELRLIEKRDSESDKRKFTLCLTAEGEELIREKREDVVRSLGDVFRDMDRDELDRLIDGFAVLDNFFRREGRTL